MNRSLPTTYSQHLAGRREELLIDAEGRSHLSLRGFWVGSFLSFFLAIGAPYANMAMRSSNMAFDFNTPGAIFLFLVLIGFLNTLFKVTARDFRLAVGLAVFVVGLFFLHYTGGNAVNAYAPGFWFSIFLLISFLANLLVVWRGGTFALNRAELVLVYVMLLVVSALCTMGMTQQLLPAITGILYFASPENKWAVTLFPFLSKRGVIVDDGSGNEGFYEGGALDAIPYEAWVEPLCWWALFLLALYMVMVSTAVILRRQWVERERLAYPLIQVGVAMVRGEQGRGLFNGFLKNRALWLGVAIPLFYGSLKALNQYDPSMPNIQLIWALPLIGSQTVELWISFALIGFSYLISTQVAAGIWIFYLLSKFEAEFLAVSGLKSTSKFIYGVADQPLLAYQGGGALIAMVLLGLWMARGHLWDVLRKALGRAADIDDGDEIMSYRAAVGCLLCGLLGMIGWLWLMGTELWVGTLFVGVAILIFIGITRVVCEAGLAAVRSPMIAPDLIVQGIGSQWIGTGGIFNLSFAYIWSADIRIFLMAMVANGLKLIEDMDRESRRVVFWAIVLAIFIGAVGSCWMVFHLAYKYGGINLDAWRFRGGPATIYDMARRTLEPAGADWLGLSFFAGGAAVMVLLTWARQYLLWWPLHPLGFAIGANFMMNKAWFCVLTAWSIKKLVMRFGGPARYRGSQYFFMGLIMGEALCNGLWLVIDYFTGKIGNKIFILG
ncbi:MAG: DUF6785 family protein [Candidatus Latescibacterota bacterium]|nr:DUF6785 family protein [Candidatus Latescibacterota bacterium]